MIYPVIKFYIEAKGKRIEIDNVISCEIEERKVKVEIKPDWHSESYRLLSDLEYSLDDFKVYIDYLGKITKTRGFFETDFICSSSCYSEQLENYYIKQYGQEYVNENAEELFDTGLAGCLAIKTLYLEVIE